MRGLQLIPALVFWGAFGLAQEPPAAPQPSPVDAKELKVRHRPAAPDYPPLARLAKVQGLVKLRITLDAKGRVEQVEALEGPPILRPSAVAFYKAWTFEPVEIGGVPVRARCEFHMPFTLANVPVEAGDGGMTQVVLEIEEAPFNEPVSGVLAAFRVEAGTWLTQSGLVVVGAEKADPSRTLLLKLSVQAFRTLDGLYVHNVIERASLLADRGLDENTPGKPQRIHFVNHVLGQKGETGFQSALMDTLRRSLRELVVPPPARSVPGTQGKGESPGGGHPPGGGSPGKTGIQDFDFSQIKIKRQPRAPHYPLYAKEHHIQGTVIVLITIDPAGTPILAEALAGPPALLTTAIGYALDWEFEPARLNGVPQFARFKLTMPFRLR